MPVGTHHRRIHTRVSMKGTGRVSTGCKRLVDGIQGVVRLVPFVFISFFQVTRSTNR